MSYAELHCKTNFSFLEGASHAEELVRRAAELGCAALAITDKNSLAGVVRAHSAAKENRAAKDAGLKLIVGAEITLRDAPSVVLWASDRAAYGRLCRLLTLGRRRAEKGECLLSFEDLAEHAEGLLAGVIAREEAASKEEVEENIEHRTSNIEHRREEEPWRLSGSEFDVGCSMLDVRCSSAVPSLSVWKPPDDLAPFRDLFSDRAYLLAELPRGPDDASRLKRLIELSKKSGLPLVAAGDVHYHVPGRMVLHDVLTATRHGMTVAEAETASLLFPNAWRHLKSPAEMAAAFAAAPGAVEQTLEIAARCTFSLDELKYEYPEELAPPGVTPLKHLRRLTWEGARRRYQNANIEHRSEDRKDEDQLSGSECSTLDVRCSMFDVHSSPHREDSSLPDEAIPANVRQLLEYELALIEELRYEAYFLTVWDLVRFAESRGILCQGRGSAANSAVCYCLGVTAVDPSQMDVLFERFVSRERDEAPDIDLDFEHERREEVLQYVYEKYGRERAGMTAEVITYRSRSAVRDVGKALGLSLAQVDALAKQVEGYTHEPKLVQRCREVGLDPESDIGRRLVYLVNELIGFPRHLSQHVGGMVITRGPLCELVPIENAAMPGRTVIEWNKDDLDDLGMLKVDCLALGMLTAIRKCFDLVRASGEEIRNAECGMRNCSDSKSSSIPHSEFRTPHSELTLASVPQNDPAVYDMICRADTIGVFQIESRGQMSMLPRLKPRCYYDLVIEVAIVRPGPIQGNMVHPYLRRRAGREKVTYPNDAIRAVLHKTLGVPIFQEQAMRLAVVAAGFTPGEADQLRRAMGAWRRPGVIDQFQKKLIEGMLARGLSRQFAEQVFQQIRGFGEYGFPESHAASFARLVYVSAWLKHYYPAEFCAAILNSQPMGFYAPAQLVRDARDHGVEVLPADVNQSPWDCQCSPHAPREESIMRSSKPKTANSDPLTLTLSPEDGGEGTDFLIPKLRLGLRLISGLSQRDAETIERERSAGPFASLDDFAARTKLSRAVIARLAEADAFGSLGHGRRQALWEALGQEQRHREMPLFDHVTDIRGTGILPVLDKDHRQDACATEEAGRQDARPTLPPMTPQEEVFADYRTAGLSLKAHPISFYRAELDAMNIVPTKRLQELHHNRPVRVAGIVILRQRPSTAKGITFVTLEDETGIANLVVHQNTWDRFYTVARRASGWLATGRLEKKDGVIHVVVSRLEDLSQKLQGLQTQSRDFR